MGGNRAEGILNIPTIVFYVGDVEDGMLQNVFPFFLGENSPCPPELFMKEFFAPVVNKQVFLCHRC